MILFPLMATWMWFQIFVASPLSTSRCLFEDTSDACLSLLPIRSKGD
ncbi:hypothetical protein ACVIW0_000998 [Bradyrhizobium sp. USDA 4454]